MLVDKKNMRNTKREYFHSSENFSRASSLLCCCMKLITTLGPATVSALNFLLVMALFLA